MNKTNICTVEPDVVLKTIITQNIFVMKIKTYINCVLYFARVYNSIILKLLFYGRPQPPPYLSQISRLAGCHNNNKSLFSFRSYKIPLLLFV